MKQGKCNGSFTTEEILKWLDLPLKTVPGIDGFITSLSDNTKIDNSSVGFTIPGHRKR